jgi:hypothetical protein
MSPLDLILGQKVIILTIGAAIVLLAAAVLLTLIPRIRRHQAEVLQRRAEQTRIAAEMAEAEAAEGEVVRPAPAKRRRKDAKEAAADKPVTAAPPPVIPVAKAPIIAVSPEQPQAAQGGQSPPSTMQDILSSVFADEGNAERQAALLQGTVDVDMSHLLTLCQQVIIQMRGGKMVTVVDSKELE